MAFIEKFLRIDRGRKKEQRQTNQVLTNAIGATVMLTESFARSQSKLQLPETRIANRQILELALTNMWDSPIWTEPLTAVIGDGKQFAGIELYGEKWTLRTDLPTDPQLHVYLGSEDLRKLYLNAGGKQKMADKLFGQDSTTLQK